MPHVRIQIFPGKTETQKQQLAEAIVQDFIQLFDYDEEAVSVAIAEIDPDAWKEKVYQEEILNKQETVYKKPGYTM